MNNSKKRPLFLTFFSLFFIIIYGLGFLGMMLFMNLKGLQPVMIVMTGWIFVPFLIMGWLGVYFGKTWGPSWIYGYFLVLIMEKMNYFFKEGFENTDLIIKFVLDLFIFILVILCLNSKSWKEWVSN